MTLEEKVELARQVNHELTDDQIFEVIRDLEDLADIAIQQYLRTRES